MEKNKGQKAGEYGGMNVFGISLLQANDVYEVCLLSLFKLLSFCVSVYWMQFISLGKISTSQKWQSQQKCKARVS